MLHDKWKICYHSILCKFWYTYQEVTSFNQWNIISFWGKHFKMCKIRLTFNLFRLFFLFFFKETLIPLKKNYSNNTGLRTGYKSFFSYGKFRVNQKDCIKKWIFVQSCIFTSVTNDVMLKIADKQFFLKRFLLLFYKKIISFHKQYHQKK